MLSKPSLSHLKPIWVFMRVLYRFISNKIILLPIRKINHTKWLSKKIKKTNVSKEVLNFRFKILVLAVKRNIIIKRSEKHFEIRRWISIGIGTENDKDGNVVLWKLSSHMYCSGSKFIYFSETLRHRIYILHTTSYSAQNFGS